MRDRGDDACAVAEDTATARARQISSAYTKLTCGKLR